MQESYKRTAKDCAKKTASRLQANFRLVPILLQRSSSVRKRKIHIIKTSTSSPGLFPQKWVGREKALASAGHVYSLNIPEKLIYMQPAGFALTEGSNNGK